MADKKHKQDKHTEKQARESPDNEKVPFGNFLQGISNFIDLVAQLDEEGKEIRREGEFNTPSGRARASFGMTIKSGLGDITTERPATKPASKLKSRQPGDEEKQPFIDVFDEGDYIRMLIEIPGTKEKDIHTEVHGDVFILSFDSGEQHASKEVVLPTNVDADSLESKYKNGILEIKMSKKKHD
jgi:HSP20 family protein